MGKLLASLNFTVLFIIQLKSNSATAVEARDTFLLGASLSGNERIISKNGTFELGFFSPNGTNLYIGIWYAQIPEKTYVWVANRETPARNRPGVLMLSKDGNLILFDTEGKSLWSVNTTNKASRAVLLDSGNFLMLTSVGNESNIVWQSFDNPADTWLPRMVFGGYHRKLFSWKNSMDPAPGLFSFAMDPSGAEQFVLTWNNSVQYWETGIWDGKIYSGVPESGLKRTLIFSVKKNRSGLFQSYTLVPPFNALVRFVLTQSGEAEERIFDGSKWILTWSAPRDGCDVYGACGAYGICDSRNLKLCSCVEGFKPTHNHDWVSQDWASTGCVRKSPLNCSTDRFIHLGVTLPDDYALSYPAISTKKDCEKACLRNCSCTAFSFNPPSDLCQIWSGDVLNLRNSTSSRRNPNVFIRMGSSHLSEKRKSRRIIGPALGIVGALTVALTISSVFIWQRRQQRSMDRREDSFDSFLRMFTYRELKIATRNFRSEMRSGGSGSVFKGSLPDGTLVAR